MKTNLSVICFCTILVLMGCRNPNTVIKHTSPVENQSFHQKAKSSYHTVPIDSCIALERQAIDMLRKGNSQESGFEVLSYMGYLQSRAGNYKEALTYMQEAADSLKTIPRDSVDAETVLMFLANLSNLYSRFGLYDEALQKNQEAMDLDKKYKAQRESDLWRMRGTMYGKQNMMDSVYACNVRALTASYEIEDSAWRSNAIIFNRCSLAWNIIEHPDFAPDSIPAAVALLERHFSGHMVGTNMLLAGRGHFLLGNRRKGIELMEKGVDALRHDDDESLEFGLSILALSYAEAGDNRLMEIYGETTALHDTINKRKRDEVLLGKDFHYRTSELKAKNELLSKEMTISKQRTVIIIIISLFIIGVITTYSAGRILHQRRMRLLDKKKIDDLLDNNIKLNMKIEELNVELQSRKDTETEHLLISSSIFDKESEQQFRRLFTSVYPGFIMNLRKKYPSLTSANELLCMLIKLQKSNDEIAMALGISRESVTTSRYRLRTRFNLPKETNLNDFIQSL